MRALRRWEGALAIATHAPSSFLGWEKGTLSSGRKEKTILIVVSFLSFLGCVRAEALQRHRRCIGLCDCVLAPLAADVWCLVSLWLRAHTERRKKAFFPGGVHFCCHQLACTSEFARRQVRALATSPPKHSFRAESLLGGGVLLRIMMLVEWYVPLKNIAVSRSSCVQGHYLLTVNTYFFVSTILKVPTEFSFGIGMVITKK
jgi:hypothetical protein